MKSGQSCWLGYSSWTYHPIFWISLLMSWEVSARWGAGIEVVQHLYIAVLLSVIRRFDLLFSFLSSSTIHACSFKQTYVMVIGLLCCLRLRADGVDCWRPHMQVAEMTGRKGRIVRTYVQGRPTNSFCYELRAKPDSADMDSLNSKSKTKHGR